MNIKDYLHLYLGQPVKHSGDTYTLIGDDIDYFRKHPKPGPYQLVLRPLISMNESEAKDLIGIQNNSLRIKSIKPRGITYSTDQTEFGSEFLLFGSLDPERFRKLLSKGFDLFGLIEAGLAIDKTKV